MSHAPSDQPVFYQHQRRPEWGAALIAWEKPDQRGYLFEDGTLRVIARPFYRLLAITDGDRERLVQAFRRYLSELKPDASQVPLGRMGMDTVSLDQQLCLFLADFPGGFTGKSWLKKVRGPLGARPLKRHRNAAIAQAAEIFSEARLDAALQSGEHAALVDEARAMVGKTDLVTKRDLATLDTIARRADAAFTRAVKGLIHPPQTDTPTLRERFDIYATELRRVLGSFPGWALASALPALARPEELLCVRQKGWAKQARWMQRRLFATRHPNGSDYQSVVELAEQVARGLTDLGAPPRDLMDVADFVQMTTLPSAERRLAALGESSLMVDSGPAQ
jgi:hypothetical protein